MKILGRILQRNQQWKTIGGKRKYFRSKWEARYARYLEYLKCKGMIADWHHEPKTFWFEGIKRGCVSYLPDYQVTKLDGSHYYVEVKGFMDSKSATKIKRFKKYFPDETLIVIDSKWFSKNSSKMSLLIKDWKA